jgi:hypothetical protein
MMDKTQTGISKTYVVARQPMKMGDHLRQVGELVPEAADWPIQAQDAWLRQGWLEEVPLVSDADRRAVAQQWEREEAARAEAAKRAEAAADAPKPQPRPRPVQDQAGETLKCSNCQAATVFLEPPADTYWYDCGGCRQRLCALQARRGTLQVSYQTYGHALGHNRQKSEWLSADEAMPRFTP